ncbi:hypothetical protein F5141DRAFT_132113 [Pisolithus sp. B1]|nr:hypothetical protein F5141DRAFT_132113 [Pisolithus sp. B1]
MNFIKRFPVTRLGGYPNVQCLSGHPCHPIPWRTSGPKQPIIASYYYRLALFFPIMSSVILRLPGNISDMARHMLLRLCIKGLVLRGIIFFLDTGVWRQ